jgi:hypothetical protein
VRGRIRTIKPESLLDEELWDLEVETGLPVFRAFVGLWTQADREGRFEWRPRPLKAAILPYWEGDFSRVLDALTTRGFLVKYASGGREYGAVRTFKRHQVINNREQASELPAPEDSGAVSAPSTRPPRVDDACPTPLVHAHGEGKGREGKEESTREAREPAPPPSVMDERERLEDWARSRVLQGFRARYEAATGGMWPGTDRVSPDRIAAWAVSAAVRAREDTGKGSVEEWVGRIVVAALDGFFASRQGKPAKHLQIRYLAEQPDVYAEAA